MVTRTFRTLGQAAAYCEAHGLGYDCVSERGNRYVVKGNPVPRASRPKRQRKARSKETRRERDERLDDHRLLREDQHESREREEALREERAAELATIRVECKQQRRVTTSQCGARRIETRERVREGMTQEKTLRAIARQDYDARRDMTPREKEKSGLRYLMAESDSLAEHGIPPLLIPAWREDRHNISYALEPDYRAERFMERFGEDPEMLTSIQDEQERMLTPEFFARAEEESRLARAYLDDEDDEEAPF